MQRFSQHPVYHSIVSYGDKASDTLRGVPQSWWRKALILLALVWLCRSLALLFWVVMPEPELPQPQAIANPALKEARSSAGVNLEDLQALQLFGDASNAPIEQEVEEQADIPEDIVTTRLNLKLQGVVASENEDDARAIIADGNDQSLYSIGDELTNTKGVTLAQIYKERVVLNNNGNYESLWLYSEEDFKRSTSISKRYSVPIVKGGASSEERTSGSSRAPVTRKVRQDQIPKSISDVLRFNVHREAGKMVGYRVRPGRDRELFEQVGLKTNDIVTAVNGIEINDPKKIRDAYKALKTATSADLTILRDGESLSINISLDAEG